MKKINKISLKIRAIITCGIVLLAGMNSCSKSESTTEPPHTSPSDSSTFVTLQMTDYEIAGEEIAGENELQELRAYRFENGHLAQIIDHPTTGPDGHGFRLDRPVGTLYVVSNANDISALHNLQGSGISEQEWLKLTAGTKEGLPIRFFSGSTSLSGSSSKMVKMTRGFARFDLQIRTSGETAIESLTLGNRTLSTPLFAGTDSGSAAPQSGNLTIQPDKPYTQDTPGFAYVYEQTDPEATLFAEAIVDGERTHLEAKLPEIIRRNCIYVVSVTKEESDAAVQLTVEAWQKGDQIGMHPGLDGTITVDTDRSELPETATVTDSGTKLILPHNLTDFPLALDCDDELELLPLDNDDLTIEPLGSVRETYAVNLFRIQKPLFAPGVPTRTVELKFRRKGLNNVYPEDRILVTLSANPVDLEGEISFDTKSYSFDFDRYVDNELGRFTVPSDKKLTVEFEASEDPWIKLAPSDEDNNTLRVLGGWKPNDPTADGRIQRATLVICNAADGSEREEYQISRRNYGLPVTWFHGVWWCKYNARGNSKSFDDQILCASDPAVAVGKSVFDYLRDCSPEEFYDLWGWAYQGDSGIGLRVVEQNDTVVMEGFSSSVSAHINKLPADALAPDGYELPSMEEFNRMFDATDYVWMMWSGSHLLRNPWEGHSKVIREQRRRNDLSVGTVQTPDLIYIGMSSPDFPDFEPVTWYGPGAQWNADGIKHANHYNNILFAVHSPEGTGWYMAGNISALYLQKNGAGNKDTRILRFKKSPVEYIYGE